MDLDEETQLAGEGLVCQMLRLAGRNSICYVISKIYFSVEDEDVKLDCRRALYYAKRMGKKLKKYKAEKRERTRGNIP